MPTQGVTPDEVSSARRVRGVHGVHDATRARATSRRRHADRSNDRHSPAHIVAVGVGIIGGIVVGEALFSTELGVVVGGIFGGYLAHMWYGGRQIEVNLGSTPKS